MLVRPASKNTGPCIKSMSQLRTCLRNPIPAIELAANLLNLAVTAHLEGRSDKACTLIVKADMPEVRSWTESLWGKSSKYAPSGPYLSNLPSSSIASIRNPDTFTQRQLHERDGYYCRFCGIPVIRKQVRERLRKLYLNVQIWGRRNNDQHAALQCMWAQYDHLLPHSRGGGNKLDNLVVTCAPCNYGRMQYTLKEAGLQNPLEHEPRHGTWDGLERLLIGS